MPLAPKEPVTLAVAAKFAEAIRNRMPSSDWYFTGSYRRRMHLRDRTVPIGDHDILVVRRSGNFRGFAFPPFFEPEIANGARKKMGYAYLGRERMRVDFYACTPRTVGGHLLYATGPQNLEIHMRAKAKGRGWKLNQHGLFDAGNRQLDDSTEENIFELLGMQFLAPAERDSWAGPGAGAILVVKKSRHGGPDHHVLLDGDKASCDCKQFMFRREPCWAINEARQELAEGRLVAA